MNITYIFGNGFDLQVGLHTRYSDFLEEYVDLTGGDSNNIILFKDHLRSGEDHIQWWSDAEAALGKHLDEYDDDTLDGYLERVLDLEREMVEYLRRQQDLCRFDDRLSIGNVFKDFIYNSFQDFLHGNAIDMNGSEENRFHFLSFNYTSVLDRVLEICMDGKGFGLLPRRVENTTVYDWLYSVCHLHGSVDTSIVMGVNDESQLGLAGGVSVTPELRWKIIKPEMNEMAQLPGAAKGMEIIDNSDVIAIYGVSFGETDQLWWSRIIDWLKEDGSHILVLFVRTGEGRVRRTIAWENVERSRQMGMTILGKMLRNGSFYPMDDLLSQVRIVPDTERLELRPLICPEPVTADM